MTDYSARIVQAGLDQLATEVRITLDKWPSESRASIDKIDEGLVRRIHILLDRLLVVISATTPEVVPNGALDDLRRRLNSLLNATNSFDESTDSILSLSVAAEELSVSLWKWSAPIQQTLWVDAITNVATTLRMSFQRQSSSAWQELSKLTSGLRDTKVRLDEISNDLNGIHQMATSEQFRHSARNLEDVLKVRAELDRTQSQIDAALPRLDAAIARFEEQFSTAQEARAGEFAATIRETRTDVDNLRRKAVQEIEQSIQDVEREREKAKDLVSVFAGAGTGYAFGQEAKYQAEQANRWRWIAILLIFLAAASAVSILFAFRETQNTDWTEIFGKTFVGLLFGGAASYAASQSGRHRYREESARRAELQMVTLEPTIRHLDLSMQAKARMILIETLFSKDMTIKPAKDSDEILMNPDQVGLLRALLKGATKR